MAVPCTVAAVGWCALAAAQEVGQRTPAGALVEVVLTATSEGDKAQLTLTAEDLDIIDGDVRVPVTSLREIGQDPVALTLMIDTSNSIEEAFVGLQQTAIEIVRRLRPGDKAELVRFDTVSRREVAFTDDIARLESAIRRLRQSGATALYYAVIQAVQARRAGPPPPDIPGRRIIVLLSDGEDTSSLRTFGDVEKVLRQTDVMLYAIAPDADDRKRTHHELRSFAHITGGDLFAPSGRLHPAAMAERLWTDVANQFLLQYSSPETAGRREWRRIRVQSLQDNITVRVRQGYVPR